MDFRDTKEEAAFRNEVRRFLAANLPPGYGTPDYYEDSDNLGERQTDFMRSWRAALVQKRWAAAHWPPEHGGAGLSTIEQFILHEEAALARAPNLGNMGIDMIGPTLIIFGSDEQKQEFLPRTARLEMNWCQGYSEPGSGSDLASLQTRAVRDGDDYVINGQKIWTSGAHRADWMFMLARTNPDAPKHRGISMFLLDMKTPGISISPLPNMAGDHSFNQVFFDSVRVPARNMVGEVNRGWYVGATLLDFERTAIHLSIGLRNAADDLVQFAREQPEIGGAPLIERTTVRYELADRLLDSEIAKLLSYRIISMQKKGFIPNHEASINKVFRTESQQRLAATGMKLIGPYGGLYRGDKWAPLGGRLAHYYLDCVARTIGGGTKEINRNIIAQRGLGLPRD
jgi:alkylation response protein AidB-like acyl-CoA dehydrogenase